MQMARSLLSDGAPYADGALFTFVYALKRQGRTLYGFGG